MDFSNYITKKYNPKSRKQGEDIGILINFPYTIDGFQFSCFLKDKVLGTKTQFTCNIDTTNKRVLNSITDIVSAGITTKTYDWEFWQTDNTGFKVCLFAGEMVIGK